MAGRPFKTDPRQQRLELHEPDFIERLRLLDAVACERSGLSRAAWGNVVALLKAIAKAGDTCWASVAWLADKSGLPRTTLHRARAQAIELGLLVTEARYNQHGRTTSLWRVDWLAVAQLDRRQATAPVSNWGESHFGAGESHSGMGESQSGSGNLLLNLPNKTSSTTNHGSAHSVRAEQPEWQVVVVEIEGAGINQAVAAVAAARSLGATPAELLAVLAYWRVHRDGFEFAEHALYRRLRRTASGDDPRCGWPAWRKGYRPPAEIAAQRAAEHRAAAERAERRRREAGPREAIDVMGEYKKMLRQNGGET
jgi:hypothetical protein